MNWKKFDELDREYPESIVEKRITGFENATDGLARLIIIRFVGTRTLSSEISGEFRFELVLISPALKEYKFKIMSFGYGITLSPIYYRLEKSIDEEIYGRDFLYTPNERIIESVEEFNELLTQIFESNAFELVVRGLIKVAKRNDL